MTRHRRILVVSVFLVAGGAGWWWANRARDTVELPIAPAGREKEVPLTPGASPDRSNTIAPAAGGSKREAVREVLSALNHQPIEFYGKVIDQYEVPVADAEVNAQIIYNTGLASGVKKPTTLTDSNGYFSFTGFMGRTLDFDITKTGYQFTPEGDAFDYTKLVTENRRHHPDSRNPVILKMWKLRGGEPLVQSGRHIDISPDGIPITVDLLTRKLVADGGDIIIKLKHQTWPHGAVVEHYDWRAEIDAVEGGFIDADQRIGNMLLAPESGYLPSLVITMAAKQSDWSKTVTKNVYLKSRGNIYSRLVINIECNPIQPTSTVQLGWWLNPSGSRNLEYDPAKRIETK